jgi:hypothetical protein
MPHLNEGYLVLAFAERFYHAVDAVAGQAEHNFDVLCQRGFRLRLAWQGSAVAFRTSRAAVGSLVGAANW